MSGFSIIFIKKSESSFEILKFFNSSINFILPILSYLSSKITNSLNLSSTLSLLATAVKIFLLLIEMIVPAKFNFSNTLS